MGLYPVETERQDSIWHTLKSHRLSASQAPVGLWFRVHGSGFRVQDSGFRVHLLEDDEEGAHEAHEKALLL